MAMRSEEEITKIHNIFAFLVDNVIVIKSKRNGEDLDPELVNVIFRTSLEILCWVLKHPKRGENFAAKILELEADLFSQLGVDFYHEVQNENKSHEV